MRDAYLGSDCVDDDFGDDGCVTPTVFVLGEADSTRPGHAAGQFDDSLKDRDSSCVLQVALAKGDGIGIRGER